MTANFGLPSFCVLGRHMTCAYIGSTPVGATLVVALLSVNYPTLKFRCRDMNLDLQDLLREKRQQSLETDRGVTPKCEPVSNNLLWICTAGASKILKQHFIA